MGLHHNVLEMFKAKGIQWKPGVDPEAAIAFIKGQLFKSDGTPNRIPPDVLMKAFVQPGSATSGLAQYDLEQGARLLYPITTILRNMIPRVTGGTGIQANWRAITAVNPTNLNIGLSEGHRGGAMSQTVVDKTASFKTSGMDNYVTEQAYLAAVTFEDLYALSATETLQGTMEAEEHLDIGGNNSIALGTTPTPTQGATASTGGFLSDATYSVICVALTYLGTANSTPPTGQGTATLAGGAIVLPYTRANMDGSSDLINGFSGAQSAALSVTLSGGTATQVINAAVAAVNGAFGYAWYLQNGGT